MLSDKALFEALIPDNPYGWPIEFRQVDPMDFLNPQPKDPKVCIWFNAASPLASDMHIHQQLLTSQGSMTNDPRFDYIGELLLDGFLMEENLTT